MLVSHFVLEDVLEDLENGDMEALKPKCQDIVKNYKRDHEGQKLCKEILEYIEEPEEGRGDKLKKKLENLIHSRKLESSGGKKLWFKKRRRAGDRMKSR